MPYISQQARKELKEQENRVPNTAGELNYVLTIICHEYFFSHGKKYQQINDILGALEGCKLEFYRRLVRPYEDKKIQENGDIY